MAISCIDVVLALTLAFVEISIPVSVRNQPIEQLHLNSRVASSATSCLLEFGSNEKFLLSVPKLGFSMHRFISRFTHHLGHLYINCNFLFASFRSSLDFPVTTHQCDCLYTPCFLSLSRSTVFLPSIISIVCSIRRKVSKISLNHVYSKYYRTNKLFEPANIDWSNTNWSLWSAISSPDYPNNRKVTPSISEKVHSKMSHEQKGVKFSEED